MILATCHILSYIPPIWVLHSCTKSSYFNPWHCCWSECHTGVCSVNTFPKDAQRPVDIFTQEHWWDYFPKTLWTVDMFAQGCFTLYSAHLPFAANVTCVDIGSNIYLSGNKKMLFSVLRIADLRTINISLHCCSLNFCFLQAGFWAIICLIRTYSFVLFSKNDIFKYSFVFIFATIWYVTHFPEQSLTSNQL